MQGTAFSSSHLFLTTWLVRYPVSGFMTTHMGMASASLSGVYAPFPKSSVLFVPAMLEVWEVTLLLGFGQLGLMGACSIGA